jgi:SAM-dependent methyltransferase
MSDLASELFTSHPPLMVASPEEENGKVTDILYERLSPEFDKKLIELLTGIGKFDLVDKIESLRTIPREYKRIVLQYGAAFLSEETINSTGVSPANPPSSVHSMVRDPFFAGDFYNCDMIVNTLYSAGITIAKRGSYLDFGASSGRVVRNMRAAYPDAKWHACDPQEETIKWAQENLHPSIEFFVSPLAPPLLEAYSNKFDGVFAISVWSHFTELAALAWFNEMHRCIKPGGWLLFTTHGPNTLRHYAQANLKVEEHIRAIHSTLFRDGYVFEDVFGPSGDWGIPAVDWGNCYMMPSWVSLNLVGRGWSMRDYNVGRNAMNQDLYLLIRH